MGSTAYKEYILLMKTINKRNKKMKRKITCVIICTLLIFATVFSVAGTMIIDKTEELLSPSPYNDSNGISVFQC